MTPTSSTSNLHAAATVGAPARSSSRPLVDGLSRTLPSGAQLAAAVGQTPPTPGLAFGGSSSSGSTLASLATPGLAQRTPQQGLQPGMLQQQPQMQMPVGPPSFSSSMAGSASAQFGRPPF